MTGRVFCLVCCLCAALAAHAESSEESSLAGQWVGMFKSTDGEQHFELELAYEGDALQGILIPVEEGGGRIPADAVDFEDGVISVTARQGAVVLEARVAGDEMEGTANLPGGEMSMLLARKGSSRARTILDDFERRLSEMRGQPLELVRSGPGMDAVDDDALNELLQAAEASYTTSLALMHDGELVGEWYRGDQPEPVHAMSVTKAVLHLVIGRLITLGKLESTDTPVHHFYSQWAEDEQRAAITIRHLLAHTSGVDRGQPATPIYQSGDFVQFALNAPLEFEPGTEMVYSNNATNVLGGIVGQVIDGPLDEFLAEDLFGRLGIDNFNWGADPAGNPVGMAGLHLTAGDLVLLGQLVLNRGRWQDEQLIEAEWFEQSFVPGSEHSERIGLIWLLEQSNDQVVGAHHDGYLGQWLGVRFEERLVGARMIANSMAYDPETDRFLDFLEYLPPLVNSGD